jgi:hypothetical protein
MWGGAIIALMCLGFAVSGFTALEGLDDPALRSDAKGFAWFWMFLAAVCGGFAALAWWLARGTPNDR